MKIYTAGKKDSENRLKAKTLYQRCKPLNNSEQIELLISSMKKTEGSRVAANPLGRPYSCFFVNTFPTQNIDMGCIREFVTNPVLYRSSETKNDHWKTA